MKLFKRSYLKHAWKIILIIVVLSFIIGQFAFYLIAGLQ